MSASSIRRFVEPQSPQLLPQVHSRFFQTPSSHNSALTLSSSLCGVHVGEHTETTMPQSYSITFYPHSLDSGSFTET